MEGREEWREEEWREGGTFERDDYDKRFFFSFTVLKK